MPFATLLLFLLGCPALECEEGGVTYASGESWTCADGCNTCSCENGAIASTLMACAGCSDETGDYQVGEEWLCPDGCNTCFCEEDGSISSTNLACD